MALEQDDGTNIEETTNDIYAGASGSDDDIDTELEEAQRLAYGKEDPAAEEETAEEETAEEETAEEETPEEKVTEKKIPPEETSEEEGEEEGARDKDDYRIPKHRYDRVAAKYRASQERVQQLEQAQRREETGAGSDFKLEDIGDPNEMFDNVLQGDVDKASAAFQSMIQKAVAAGVEHAQKGINDVVTTRTTQLSTAQQYDQKVDQLFETYPVLDSESPDYDADLSELVVTYHQTLVSGGRATAVEALDVAVQDILSIKRPDLFEKLAEKEATATKKVAAQKTDKRTRESLEKKIGLSEQQPPKARTGEEQEALPSIENLSLEDLDALPESVLKKMRGDFL